MATETMVSFAGVQKSYDGETLVVRLPMEERAALIEGNPDVFSVTDHYRNYAAVLVNLLAVNRETLGRMIEGAWRLQASRTQVAAYDRKGARATPS